ncbi:MAG: hypothetical protein WD315_04595 [Balneolaceae bacterium]
MKITYSSNFTWTGSSTSANSTYVTKLPTYPSNFGMIGYKIPVKLVTLMNITNKSGPDYLLLVG